MGTTIFARIIAGEIPCHRVYENDDVLAFLDVNPISQGHTLLVPKEPAVTMADLSDDASAALGRALPRVCRAVLAATGTRDFNILQNNGRVAHQAVMHVHFHIIPRHADGSGLGVGWKPGPLDQTAGAELAERMRAELLS